MVLSISINPPEFWKYLHSWRLPVLGPRQPQSCPRSSPVLFEDRKGWTLVISYTYKKVVPLIPDGHLLPSTLCPYHLLAICLMLYWAPLCSGNSVTLYVTQQVDPHCFFVDSLEFSVQTTLSSENKVLCLPFHFLCLLYFSCLIAFTRTSSTMLSMSRDSGHPCLVPSTGGKHSVFHH